MRVLDNLGLKIEMFYLVGHPNKHFGQLFYKPFENKMFVDRGVVFQEKLLIFKRVSGSHTDFYKIQESTNKEPKVGHNI